MRATRGAIAAALGRQSTEVGHPLAVLEDAGYLLKRGDAFRPRRPTWQIVPTLETAASTQHDALPTVWVQPHQASGLDRDGCTR